MITVTIRYRTAQGHEWQEVSVNPDEYFWRDPDHPDKPWDVDDPPKHDKPEAYLPVSADQVVATIVRIVDSLTGDSWEVARECRDGASTVSLTTASLDGKPWRELILTTALPLKQNGSQVIRVDLSEETPRITMNTLMWGPSGDEESLVLLDTGIP